MKDKRSTILIRVVVCLLRALGSNASEQSGILLVFAGLKFVGQSRGEAYAAACVGSIRS